MRQEKERFFQIIFEENSHVLFRYICGQLNNDRETAKDVLNDVWEVLVVKFETVAALEGEEMTNCIQNLNPMDQRIFWGRAYGFSYKELSGFCKKSEQALQCQYSRAIKKLQGMMSQEISLTRA